MTTIGILDQDTPIESFIYGLVKLALIKSNTPSHKEVNDMVTAKRPYRTTLNTVHKLQKIMQRIAESDGNMIAKEIWHEEDIERYALSGIDSM